MLLHRSPSAGSSSHVTLGFGGLLAEGDHGMGRMGGEGLLSATTGFLLGRGANLNDVLPYCVFLLLEEPGQSGVEGEEEIDGVNSRETGRVGDGPVDQ